MKTVYKFDVGHKPRKHLMPPGAKVVSVALQYDEPFLWVLLDPDMPCNEVEVAIFGTGEAIPDDWQYAGTYHEPPYVWHVCTKGIL